MYPDRLNAKLVVRGMGFCLLFAICIYLGIGQLMHEIQVVYYTAWQVHLWRCTDALLLALPILFTRKRLFHWLYTTACAFYLLSVSCYFRTYFTIMPLSSYLLVNNLHGLRDSVIASIRWLPDGLMVLPLVAFMLLRGSRRLERFVGQVHWRVRAVGGISLLVILSSVKSIPYWYEGYYEQSPMIHFNIVPVRAFKEYGMVNYWVTQVARGRSVTSDERLLTTAYINKHRLYVCNADNLAGDTLPVPKKNLIVLLVESLQSWAIGLEVAGIQITPCLDSLVARGDSKTLYFPKMLPQVKDGRSSDAQLLINTGLLPLQSGSASSLCADNTFPALPALLRSVGYTTMNMICDDRDFWNQGAISKAFGFDILYDKMRGEAGLYDFEKFDRELFKRSIPILVQSHKPFYAQMVSLSTHMPYDKPQAPDSPLMLADSLSDEVRNYLIAVNLFDCRLKSFLHELQAEGLYDDTYIVIAGDHEQVTKNKFDGRDSRTPYDCMVPFIILNSPYSSKHQDAVVGQVDIYPTLLHLMEVQQHATFKGLGENLFGDEVSNCASFRGGSIVNGCEVADSVVNHRKELWMLSDIMLRMDFFFQP